MDNAKAMLFSFEDDWKCDIFPMQIKSCTFYWVCRLGKFSFNKY